MSRHLMWVPLVLALTAPLAARGQSTIMLGQKPDGTSAKVQLDASGNVKVAQTLGSSSAPMRVDPTGTTLQPVAVTTAAKGTTPAAVPTSTDVSAGRQPLDVILYDTTGAPVTPAAGGQQIMANSVPVVVAADQTAVPVSLGLSPAGTAWTSGSTGDAISASTRLLTGTASARVISDVLFSASAAVALRLVRGTGTVCGSGTAVILPTMYLAANTVAPVRLSVPIAVPPSEDVCVQLATGTGSFSALVAGTVGP